MTDDPVHRFLAAVDAYPPEIMDEGGAWRLGGAAARAWEKAFADLRASVEEPQGS